MLSTSDLTMSFGGTPAVKDVNVTINRGEIAAVIGPNGAGKTTLLNMISGSLKPTAGTVTKGDTALGGLPAHRRVHEGMGRTFQQPSFFPELTVVENVQVPLSSLGGTWARLWGRAACVRRDRAMEILESIGLADLADVKAARMSYGDQRRLEIGIALGTGPEILLLDEPMAGMSYRERATLSQLLLGLNGESGLTVLFTEHDMDVVFTLSTVVHVLYQGQLFASGTPEEIRNDPGVRQIYLGTEVDE